jgi:molybdopterin synthase catalytic subunit
MKNYFKEGAIETGFIGDSIFKHQSKKSIGAHQLFLGQVRADEVDGKLVEGIEYSAHQEIANSIFETIKEEAFSKFEIICLHIYHSFGFVKSGEICLFVFVSSGHRKEAQQAIEYIVEEIKKRVPVFGKEFFEDESYIWKVNK